MTFAPNGPKCPKMTQKWLKMDQKLHFSEFFIFYAIFFLKLQKVKVPYLPDGPFDRRLDLLCNHWNFQNCCTLSCPVPANRQPCIIVRQIQHFFFRLGYTLLYCFGFEPFHNEKNCQRMKMYLAKNGIGSQNFGTAKKPVWH